MVTGYFGPLTEHAVQSWQSMHQIVSSGTAQSTGYGSVGPKTRAAITQAQLSSQVSTQATSTQSTTGAGDLSFYNQTSCFFNGLWVTDGTHVSAYRASMPAAGSSCELETRTCTHGVLSGSYAYNSCTPPSNGGEFLGGGPKSCVLSTRTVESGQTVTAYKDATVASGGTCVSEVRTCTNGTLSGSYANLQCMVTQPAGPTPSGWDYDLTKECAITTGNPGDANYYADTKQCTSVKHWALVVESENAPGASCPGPGNRSFPINGANSPISLSWIPHTSDIGSNWTVNLKVDQNTTPNPCGDDYFTYFGMMDHHDLNGGPLPDMTHLSSSHAVAYGEYTPRTTDSARLLVGAQVFWDGKAHILEVDLARSQWENPAAHPAGTIYVNKDFGGSEYVVLDAAYWNIAVADDSQAHTVTVPWNTLFAKAIASGWFTAPTGPNATQAVYIGTEVKGRAVGNLYQTNFRVSSVQ